MHPADYICGQLGVSLTIKSVRQKQSVCNTPNVDPKSAIAENSGKKNRYAFDRYFDIRDCYSMI